MKILSKEKDYYDYLTGVYGIDNYVVFDRRYYQEFENSIFDFTIKEQRSWWYKPYDHNGEILFVFEIGTIQYLFKANVNGIELIKKFNHNKRIFNVQKDNWTKEYHYNLYKDMGLNNTYNYAINKLEVINVYLIDGFILEEYHRNKHFFNNITFDIIINNAILHQNGVFCPKKLYALLSPDEVYDNIYNFLLSEKEPKYKDNMTDVEKLLSKGFDKKISFRKM